MSFACPRLSFGFGLQARHRQQVFHGSCELRAGLCNELPCSNAFRKAPGPQPPAPSTSSHRALVKAHPHVAQPTGLSPMATGVRKSEGNGGAWVESPQQRPERGCAMAADVGGLELIRSAGRAGRSGQRLRLPPPGTLPVSTGQDTSNGQAARCREGGSGLRVCGRKTCQID